MALSTSMPRDRMRLNRTTMFMVNPTNWMILTDNSMESGIASPTNDALRTPMKKSRTDTTSMRPDMMLFSRLLTILSISFDWSDVILITVPRGKFGSALAMTALTASAVPITFSPLRFFTPRETTGLSSNRA